MYAGKRIKLISIALLLVAASAYSYAQSPSNQTAGAPANEPLASWSSNNSDPQTAPANKVVRTLLVTILLIIALGIAAVYLSKKFLPRFANIAGKEITLLETVYLGPGKTVNLLAVGQRRLLVATTKESITMLADVTQAYSSINLEKTDDK